MAAITKSWLETHCTQCDCRRVFVLKDGWVLVCSTCGVEKKLEKTGIVAV